MPTKDHLSKIDEEHVLYLLQLYLTQVNSTSVVWVLPYVYELVIVLICKRGGLGISQTLYLQLHYSIVFLLRKENIYE